MLRIDFKFLQNLLKIFLNGIPKIVSVSNEVLLISVIQLILSSSFGHFCVLLLPNYGGSQHSLPIDHIVNIDCFGQLYMFEHLIRVRVSCSDRNFRSFK